MNIAPAIAFYGGEENTEFSENVRASLSSSLSDDDYSIVPLVSKKETIDYDILDKKRIDLLVLSLDPTKKTTQEIVLQLEKRKLRFVMVVKGTSFQAAVAQIRAAIHESRVRLLNHLAKRDFKVGAICISAIVILACVTRSPAAKFLGTFCITVLLFEFGFFYISASRKKA